MPQRACDQCSEAYEAKRASSRYCSSGCRANASKGKPPAKRAQDEREALPVAEGAKSQGLSTVGRVRAALEEAGRLETWLGASAVSLAERIDAATAVMGYAGLVKELRATMAQALAGAEKSESDVVDELQAARERRRATS